MISTSTLDAVRLTRSAKEAELRRRTVGIEHGRSFCLIRMEEELLLLEDALGRPLDLGETDSFRPQLQVGFERHRIPIF